MPDVPLRCAAASLERREPLAGTAANSRVFLAIEHPGPWGVDALRDARMPPGQDEWRDRVRAACAAARVRPLLIRRPAGSPAEPSGGIRVYAAFADAHAPWMETAVLASWEDVAALDVAALGAGRSPRLTPTDELVALVCTHGRHDVCCAERGRPVAASLAQSHPEQTWEVSHVGGDRYAANLVLLPHGLYHGRVDTVSAEQVVDRAGRGLLVRPLLRGRSGWRTGVQVAELALRDHLDEDRVDALRVLRWHPDPDGTPGGVAHLALRENPEAAYAVTVTPRRGPRARLTCAATDEGAPWVWSSAVAPL
ncbi:sucrase ferredoxin [Nocardioides massiliensis]|uniref:Sucrase ferredoxin n=1 Tax=Nocardioides massiliensis TaxID=1325935 RepID=A0ABT9NN95_9ACTN|nr:sucrase ferredoxin [Nocardioides massiliensis]MDP9821520.1 hypothetical protein [Nocardioides massiliensis]